MEALGIVLLMLGSSSVLFFVLGIIHPKLTPTRGRITSRKSVAEFYGLLAVVAFIGGNIALDNTPERKAEKKAEKIAMALDRLQSLPLSDHRGRLGVYLTLTQLAPDDTTYQEKLDYYKMITEKDAKAYAIPASDLQGNLKAYQELLELEPDNEFYKKKVAHYEEAIRLEPERRARAEAERKRKERERREAERRVAKWGPMPENSPWDGSVREVKQYLKAVALDPESLKYEHWWPPIYSDSRGWLVKCDWRGKNAFGGYVRSIDVFVIQHGRVVDVEHVAP